MNFNDLISMKKSNKKPSEGDVFVIQPKESMYFFGKVIKTEIKSKDGFINGMSLIYIYDKCSNNKNQIGELNPNSLLIPPIIVNNQPWRKGYFETIGSIDVTEEDLAIDFGFYHSLKKKFLNAHGDGLATEPKIWSEFGLGSYGVVGRLVQKAINDKKIE